MATTKMQVECQECGKKFSTGSFLPKCPRCKGVDIDVAGGDPTCSRCGWGPLGCRVERTGCTKMKQEAPWKTK